MLEMIANALTMRFQIVVRASVRRHSWSGRSAAHVAWAVGGRWREGSATTMTTTTTTIAGHANCINSIDRPLNPMASTDAVAE